MARAIAGRIQVDGWLCTAVPLHVGGAGDSGETDMPLARNGRGEFYVPGTALAGPMRAWMERAFGYVPLAPKGSRTALQDKPDWSPLAQNDRSDLLDLLWGYQDPRGGDGGAASHLFVEDGTVELPEGLDREIWDGVGIDREWGAAAERVKFDRAVLPRGSRIRLALTLELPPTDSGGTGSLAGGFEAALGHLLLAMEKGELRFGGATTRGLGRVRLEELEVRREDWSGRAGVLAFLTGNLGAESPQGLISAGPTLQPAATNGLELTLHWRPRGPVMTKADRDGMTVDMLPMVSGSGSGKVTLVLPGSGIKGALREQAERIVRTVLDWPAAGSAQAPINERHLRQLEVPLAAHLFGIAKPSSSRRVRHALVGEAARGVIAVDTCYAYNTPFAIDQWRKVADATGKEAAAEGEKSELHRALDRAGLPQGVRFEQAFHVAVDRWTGGAAESFLYSAIEPFGVEWEPIRLSVDMAALQTRFGLPEEDASTEGGPADAALALLLLLLRDLMAGRIPLGFGSNRGYGSVAVDRVEIDGGEPWGLPAVLLPGLEGVAPGRLEALTRAWQQWIEQAPTGRNAA